MYCMLPSTLCDSEAIFPPSIYTLLPSQDQAPWEFLPCPAPLRSLKGNMSSRPFSNAAGQPCCHIGSRCKAGEKHIPSTQIYWTKCGPLQSETGHLPDSTKLKGVNPAGCLNCCIRVVRHASLLSETYLALLCKVSALNKQHPSTVGENTAFLFELPRMWMM